MSDSDWLERASWRQPNPGERKARGRRPRGSVAATRMVTVRLTEDEFARLDDAARDAGQSMADWMRSAIAAHAARKDRA